MKPPKPMGEIQIVPRDPSGHVWLVMVDGLVRRAGTLAQCEQLLRILTQPSNPPTERDAALREAIEKTYPNPP